jgi:hypothetical protein
VTPTIRAAFSVDPRPAVKSDSPWCLPRYVCGDNWESPDALVQILANSV